MKIGYPCINRSLACRSSRTFRLASYSDERLETTVAANLACLQQILEFNLAHHILFFRITSDLVPFASHPVCRFPWADVFREAFQRIGAFIRANRFRISMHPDQFTLLNSPDEDIFHRSVAELKYHATVLDLLGLDTSAKIQLHVGGVYGDRAGSLRRFVQRAERLPKRVRRRLVIENDDRQYPLADCLQLHAATGLPVLFDAFHHELLNRGETLGEALVAAGRSWSATDGLPMCDYSRQAAGARAGSHAEHLDAAGFKRFLRQTLPHDFDLMLEIKDKETSALRALELARRDPRLV